MMACENDDALRRDASSEKVRTNEFALHAVVELGPCVAAKALCSTRHGEVITTFYLARIDILEASLPSFKMTEPGLQQIRYQKKRASPWPLPLLAASTRPEIPMTVFLSAHPASLHAEQSGRYTPYGTAWRSE